MGRSKKICPVQGLPGFPGQSGLTNSGSSSLPDLTLYVATGYSGTPDPERQFTSFSDAMAAAAALNPDFTSLIEIIAFPGVYNEDIELIDFVSITALNVGTVIIDNLSYTSVSGNVQNSISNLVVGNLTIDFTNFNFGTFTMNNISAVGTTILTGGQFTADLCIFDDGFIVTGSVLRLSNCQSGNLNLTSGTLYDIGTRFNFLTFINSQIDLKSTTFSYMNLSETSNAQLNACTCQNDIHSSDTTDIQIYGTKITGGFYVDSSNVIFRISNCFLGQLLFTVAESAGGQVYNTIMDSGVFNGVGNAYDRDIQRLITPILGDTTVVYNYATDFGLANFIDNQYSIIAQQIGGTATPTMITNWTTTEFTIQGAADGVYQITILRNIVANPD